MIFFCGVNIAPSDNKKFAGNVKKIKPFLEKVPSKTTAAKRRFSARLRKIRWVIYNMTPSKRKKLTRTLKRYKKLVKQFLDEFSSKLKPKEISIWKEKVDKTVEDVQMVLENEKGKKCRGKSRDKN